MAENSSIEWTKVRRGNVVYSGSTLNPLAGCTWDNEACDNCYAAIMARRLEFMALADIAAGKDPGRKAKYIGITNKNKAGRIMFNGKINLDPIALWEPFNTKKPTAYFFNSMSDLFHKDVPDHFIDLCYAAMLLTPQHIYQVLTKRPDRMADYLLAPDRYQAILHAANTFRNARPELGDVPISDPAKHPADHIWHGATMGTQAHADVFMPHLLRVPGITFVSYEPALEAIEFDEQWLYTDIKGRGFINQIIIGGESGPGSRPFDLQWAFDTVAQCEAAGVACFVKQMGANPIYQGQPLKLKDRKGGDMSEWPEALRVRQFPV